MKFKNILFTGTTAAVIATCVGSAFAADPMRLPTQGYVDAKIKPVDERSQANEQLLGRDTLQTTAQQVTGAINELVAGKLNTFDRAGNAIVVTDENGDGSKATEYNEAVKPFTKWDPQWKMSRYVTDINICKELEDGEHAGCHYSKSGDTAGKAVSMVCTIEEGGSNFMWGVNMSGLRIAGAFE